MQKEYVEVNQDIIGSFLGEDVYSMNGNMIVPSDTLITDYIYSKLIEFKIYNIFIYKTIPIIGDEFLKDKKINDVQKQYIEDINTVKVMVQDLASGKELDFNKAENISEHIYSRISDCVALMECVNSVRIADEYTYSHLVNVSVYSMLLGKWMGLTKKQIREVILAGLLHDVGKAQVPLEILNKRGPLDEKEFEEMKKHTIYGYEMLRNNKEISMDIKRAVIMHHEKENGAGYPFGINGSQKNLYSKIVTAADIFDAITSERVYRGRQTPFTAFKELEKIGYDTIDPKVLMVLFKKMPNYYIGAKVKMESGEIGEVVYVPNQCAYAPIIEVNGSFYDFTYEKEILIKEFL